MNSLHPIPAFSDNYIWCLHDGQSALVVDPGDAAPVLNFLDEQQLTLSAILITHHHPDHTGGVGALKEATDAKVFGPHSDQFKAVDHLLGEGDSIELLNTTLQILEVPGHTLDHIAYYAPSSEDPILFCGDTLFSGGCGRIFEGTPLQMHNSLSRLAELPEQTWICPAHEYTAANLKFAQAVEPDNSALTERVQQVSRLRREAKPTLPSTLATELATNPFLRSDQPEVLKAAQNRGSEADPVAVFNTIRKWKDNF